jgi:hypothetical protein
VASFITSFRASMIHAGASEAGVVLATDRGVQWTDWALRPTHSWPAECMPAALAVGRNGDAALVAEIDRSPWLVAFDAGGTERFRVEVPQSRGVYSDHVIVTDDGRTILSPPGSVLAFDRGGKLRWSLERRGDTAAVALADGHVLFEHAAGLLIADRDGSTRALWTAASPFAAAPVAHDDRWWVATADTLHELG